MSVELQEIRHMGTRARLDKEAGIVRDVKILGMKSKNGYEYTGKAIREATKLYEGVKVNVDHIQKGGDRSYHDRFGRLKNVRFIEGHGLYGDLHYNRGHRVASQFEWDVENEPSNVGLSHDARGKMSNTGKFVESIYQVRSVDLVADPATNMSLFESEVPRMRARRKKKSIGRLLEQSFKKLQLDPDDELLELIEAMDATAEVTPKQAMAQMIMAVFLDEDLDAEETKTKIMQILKLDQEESDDAENDDDEAAPEEDPPATSPGQESVKPKKGEEVSAEIKKLQEKLQQSERREMLRDVCEAENFKPTKVQRQALLKCEDEDSMTALVESWLDDDSDDDESDDKTLTEDSKKRRVVNKPRSQGVTKPEPVTATAFLESVGHRVPRQK